VAKVSAAADDLATYLSEPRWYQSWAAEVEGGAPGSIAYFSPEFGITEALPQYSGGLGILAGDHLKSASDLGVPIVGVGLFYKSGYFKQSLNRDGWQQETYPVLDPDDLPLALLREPDGEPCIITLDLPGGRVMRARVWKAQVGRSRCCCSTLTSRTTTRRPAGSPTGCMAVPVSCDFSRSCCSVSVVSGRCACGHG